MRVSFPATAPTDRLVFRLWPNGPLERRHGARLDLGTVTVDRRRVRTTRPDPTTLVVHLGRLLEPGDSVAASLGFGLLVPRREPDFPERLQARPGWMRLGSFFPILAWDGERWRRDPPPAIPGESVTSPIADFDVTVDGPPEWTAVATGEPAGGGRFVARAVRDFALAAGRLEVMQTTADAGRRVQVVLATAPGLPPDLPPATLRRAAESLERLSTFYGAYPWPRFTVSLFPDLRTNGIEYPTHVAVGPGSVPAAVPHETAHQWFYSLVGNNQGADPWLDEGVATWAGSRVGPGANLFRGIPLGEDVEGRLGEGMSYWNRHGDDYFRGIYVQGARALESLGPARLVDCALRGHVAANAYRVADPDDLAAALERVFPNARAVLDRFGAFEGR